jgi:AcrR family transcriptional regulator
VTIERGPKAGRADRQRTRNELLDAMGRLLETRGLRFSLPELAAESGTSTATVYRHFDDLDTLRAEFYNRISDRVITAIAAVDADQEPVEQFTEICRTWVILEQEWARAASFIRSAEGYLERVRRGEPLSSAYHRVLTPVLQRLIESGILPAQDFDYAILMWMTIFDERVFVDLEAAFSWSPEQIADHLGATLLASLGAGRP